MWLDGLHLVSYYYFATTWLGGIWLFPIIISPLRGWVVFGCWILLLFRHYVAGWYLVSYYYFATMWLGWVAFGFLLLFRHYAAGWHLVVGFYYFATTWLGFILKNIS
jgi:hypothetical protein